MEADTTADVAPLPVIGVVRTSHAELATTPIQAGLNRAEPGTLEIAEPYWEGLDGLQDFAYAWLLTWLHRPDRPAAPSGGQARRPAMRQVPFLPLLSADAPEHLTEYIQSRAPRLARSSLGRLAG
jgi:hypothetical protein